MGKGYKHGGGGKKENPLNFSVLAYPSETELIAAAPEDNTIGVITTTTISSWSFRATEPTEPAVGMLWISTGTASAAEFNALKNNGIQVYPLSVKQYFGGAWVDLVAKTYKNGEWADWVYYIVNGNQSKITSIPAYASSQWTISDNGLTLTRNSGSQASLGVTGDTFDLTGKTKFILELTNTNRELWVGFCSTTSNTSLATLKMTTGGTYTLDVSAINQVCRIRFDLEGSSSATIYKMYLE